MVVPRSQRERRWWFDVAEVTWEQADLAAASLPVNVETGEALCGQIALATASP